MAGGQSLRRGNGVASETIELILSLEFLYNVAKILDEAWHGFAADPPERGVVQFKNGPRDKQLREYSPGLLPSLPDSIVRF